MYIKVICLNTWLGGLLMDGVLEFISQERPDVLILQEAYAGTEENLKPEMRTMQTLQSEFKYLYSAFSPTFLDTTAEFKVQQGNAIISDFPIVTSNTIFYDVPYKQLTNYLDHPEDFPNTPRNLQHVVLNVDNKMVNIFNTQGIWGTDGLDNDRRLKMGATIANEVAGKDRVILAGDFNVFPNTQTIAKIEDKLTNIFKDELKTSFNLRIKDPNGFGNSVVDMIFVSKDITVVEKKCPDIDVSDHLPLIATLNIG